MKKNSYLLEPFTIGRKWKYVRHDILLLFTPRCGPLIFKIITRKRKVIWRCVLPISLFAMPWPTIYFGSVQRRTNKHYLLFQVIIGI